MSKPEKNIVSQIYDSVKKPENKVCDVEVKDGLFHFSIQHTIPIYEMPAFIADALQLCYRAESTEDPVVSYVAEWADFAFSVALIAHFTDLDLPDSSEILYEVIANTNIVEDIYLFADDAQINSLHRGFDYAVSRKNNELLMEAARKHKSPADEMFMSLKNAADKLSAIVDRSSNFMDTLNRDNIKDLLNVANQINSGKIDAEEALYNVAKKLSEEK